MKDPHLEKVGHQHQYENGNEKGKEAPKEKGRAFVDPLFFAMSSFLLRYLYSWVV
jgi:hypothetical protein